MGLSQVGYAFVNFIEVGSLLKFLKENLDKRWNLYQSEKTMYAAYATYQGKAALVTKVEMCSRRCWKTTLTSVVGAL